MRTASKSKFIAEDSVAPTQTIRDAIRHPDIDLSDDFTLRLKRLDAREDEEQERRIKLSDYWLPATEIYPDPQPLSGRLDMVAAIVLVIDEYFHRARQSKSRHEHAAFMVTTLAKFFEYLWVNEIYDLASANKNRLVFDSLPKLLAEGGWHQALGFKKRLTNALEKHGHELASKLLITGKNHLTGIVPASVKESLGSNLVGREMAFYHAQILSFYEGPFNKKATMRLEVGDVEPDGIGYSYLRQTLDTINFLADIQDGLDYVPFPESVRLAKRYGKRPGRTKNLGALEASQLISESYRWLYIHGPIVERLIEGLCQEVISANGEERKVQGYSLDDWLSNSNDRVRLEESLGTPIQGVDMCRGDGMSLRQVHHCLLTACFILVATMNARRRDEITHRKYGLHKGFAVVEDEAIGLYRATFYIEKTLQSYMEFYVNRTTWDVSQLLEKIQDTFDGLNEKLGRPLLSDSPKREQSLFGYHRLSRIGGVNPTRCWYEFESSRDGNAMVFLRRALGPECKVGPHPHMFRRLYSLVFMYQYELPFFPALNQQLCHDSLSTTMVYVTDPALLEDTKRIDVKLKNTNDARRKAFKRHMEDIRFEIATVSDEKLVETIIAILDGAPVSGGYPSYIKRFYQRVSGHVDFSPLEQEKRVRAIADVVKRRGQTPKPMRHGQCMVGAQSPALGAKCRGSDGHVRQENASPKTCGTCQFHFVNEAYLENLEADLQALETMAEDQSLPLLRRANIKVDIENLRSAIDLHRRRLYG